MEMSVGRACSMSHFKYVKQTFASPLQTVLSSDSQTVNVLLPSGTFIWL